MTVEESVWNGRSHYACNDKRRRQPGPKTDTASASQAGIMPMPPPAITIPGDLNEAIESSIKMLKTIQVALQEDEEDSQMTNVAQEIVLGALFGQEGGDA